MPDVISSIFNPSGKEQKTHRQGNGIAIFCAIVSIVTCSYSLNVETKKYNEAAEKLEEVTRELKSKKNHFHTDMKLIKQRDIRNKRFD